MSRMLYSCPNVEVSHRLVRLNLTTPCPMRAPGETPGVFALECALDELANDIGIDPIEFRLRNYAEIDEHKNRPWSSKKLRTPEKPSPCIRYEAALIRLTPGPRAAHHRKKALLPPERSVLK